MIFHDIWFFLVRFWMGWPHPFLVRFWAFLVRWEVTHPKEGWSYDPYTAVRRPAYSRETTHIQPWDDPYTAMRRPVKSLEGGAARAHASQLWGLGAPSRGAAPHNRNTEILKFRTIEISKYRNIDIEISICRNIERHGYRNIEIPTYRNTEMPTYTNTEI